MKSYKLNTFLILFSICLLPGEAKLFSRHIENLQLILDLDGQKILSNIDNEFYGELYAEVVRSENGQHSSFFKFKKKPSLKPASNEINLANPQLSSLWNSTAMIFGAAANGVGIGTSFPLKKSSDGKTFFMTNYHVVEQFCRVPENVNSDLVSNEDVKYTCQSLFVLHDISINIKDNSVGIDGPHPWKSEVLSLDYFDKQRDLAVFRINLPEDSGIETTIVEQNFDLQNLLISQSLAENVDLEAPPMIMDTPEMSPLKDLAIYLVAFSIPEQADKKSKNKNKSEIWIKKEWYKGSLQGIQTFENDKKLGFVTALKHDIQLLPGSSGAPLALSDGRIIGVNTSVEIKQFYVKAGWFKWVKYKLETYNSYFAMPATFVKDFFDKLN